MDSDARRTAGRRSAAIEAGARFRLGERISVARARLGAVAHRLAGPAGIAAMLAAGPIALLHRQTFGGRTLVPFDILAADPVYAAALAQRVPNGPWNGLTADLIYQNLPWKTFILSALAEGEAPWWNPHLFGGMPFFATGLHGMLFPSNLTFLVVGPEHAFGWAALANLCIAAGAAYLLARALDLGRSAALLAGIAWSVCLPLVANVALPMIQAGLAVAPVPLAGLIRGLKAAPAGTWLPPARSMAWLAGAAVGVMLVAFAGHIELLIQVLLIAAATIAALATRHAVVAGTPTASASARRERATVALRTVLWGGSALAIGLALSAAQVVPTYELARTNVRAGGASYDEVVGWAYGIRQIATFLIPDFFGNPSHHGVLDIESWRRIALPTHAMWGDAWGTKNYIEAASYVGVMPLLLAAVGLFSGRRRALRIGLVLLAVVALSFAFGLPTYRLMYFGIPGFDQLRTPFRWVFAYDLAVVGLAALGLDALRARDERTSAPARRAARYVGATAAGVAAWLGIVLGLAAASPGRWTALVTDAFGRLSGALAAVEAYFPSASSFAAYQFWNLAHLAVFMLAGGLLLVGMSSRRRGGPTMTAGEPTDLSGRKTWPGIRSRWDVPLVLCLAVTALDPLLIGANFAPALDAELAGVTPPTVPFLQDAADVKWGRVVGLIGSAAGDVDVEPSAEKIFWPNVTMTAGIDDIRGYDSIIPSWIADTLGAAYDQAGMIGFNRVANVPSAEDLDHPTLRGYGVRYAVSAAPIVSPGVRLLSESDGVFISEIEAAMPRAWIVNEIEVIEDRAALLEALDTLDVERLALLEERPDLGIWDAMGTGRQIFRTSIETQADTVNGLVLDVFAARPGLLVLSESYFPGWRAWVAPSIDRTAQAETRPASALDGWVAPDDPIGLREVEVPVYRANGSLRAVPVPAGRLTVRLEYFPMSAKVGLYISLLGAVLLVLAVMHAALARYFVAGDRDEVGRVAVNSTGPIAAALLNKVLQFAFALLYLRVLGPEDAGRYAFAITVYVLAEIVTNFGLNLLTAREVARRPDEASRYLVNSIVLRLGLWLLAVPALAAYARFMAGVGHPLDRSTLLAIGLLFAAMIPSHLSAAVTSVFQGLERMVTPALVTIFSTLLTVSLGALALMLGHGFVGMAGAAIVTNWLTFAILAKLAGAAGFGFRAPVSAPLVKSMALVSLPLMLNHLLQTVFFKVDILLLEPLQGEVVVGWYSSAYKWIDALLIVPSYLTMALFPLMSRRAAGDAAGLRSAYLGTLRWLLAVSLPVAVATTYLAEPLIGLLAGADYLPHGAKALQVMIWFLPFSFVNGVTQYVLIALDRQRWITLSFAVAATFNLVANLVVIPIWSYPGAAVVTIVSEIVLLAPFLYGLRDIGMPPLLVLAWRPLLGASAMALALAAAESLALPSAIGVGAALAAYALSLRVLGWVTDADRALVERLRPRSERTPLTGPAHGLE